MAETDPHNLQRFVEAQAETYEAALEELQRGRKASHWMWFVFPQLAGLGRSATAQFYGLASLDEAHAYLDHPILGPRLLACVETINALSGRSAEDVFGDIDALKLRSSLTLFAAAAPDEPAFQAALSKYFDGMTDAHSLKLLSLSATP
jgi:uncharacterized protein (DUF1810 family)